MFSFIKAFHRLTEPPSWGGFGRSYRGALGVRQDSFSSIVWVRQDSFSSILHKLRMLLLREMANKDKKKGVGGVSSL